MGKTGITVFQGGRKLSWVVGNFHLLFLSCCGACCKHSFAFFKLPPWVLGSAAMKNVRWLLVLLPCVGTLLRRKCKVHDTIFIYYTDAYPQLVDAVHITSSFVKWRFHKCVVISMKQKVSFLHWLRMIRYSRHKDRIFFSRNFFQFFTFSKSVIGSVHVTVVLKRRLIFLQRN